MAEQRQFRLSAPGWGSYTTVAQEPLAVARDLVRMWGAFELLESLPTRWDVTELVYRGGHLEATVLPDVVREGAEVREAG